MNLVVGATSIDRFQDLLERELPHLAFDGGKEERDAWAGVPRIDALLPNETVSSFVSIMRGCNYNCSYCIVPAVRGREIYRPARSILSEVRQKAALGLKEVMLLGQTVNSYRPALPNPGADGKDVADFADLLRAVDAVPGVRRIRFMSPHPFFLDEKTARAMAESPNVCRHMHLPAQSGSDAVLKRMRRNYTRGEYLKRLEVLRRFMPDIPITTDLIVGFPGETDEDFSRTLSLAAEAEFRRGLHLQILSPSGHRVGEVAGRRSRRREGRAPRAAPGPGGRLFDEEGGGFGGFPRGSLDRRVGGFPSRGPPFQRAEGLLPVGGRPEPGRVGRR